MLVEERHLFDGMSREFMDKMGRCSVIESREAGDILFRHGDPAQHLYILVEGRVRLSFGKQGYMSFVISNSGDVVGLSSILGRESYHDSAECLVPCRLKKVMREELLRIFDEDPDSGMRFFRRLASLLGQQLVNTYKLIPAAHGEKHAAPGG